MPEDRRRQLVAHAQAAGTLILEDDPYGLIRFEGTAPPAIFDLARDTTIYTLVVLEDDLARPARRLVHRPRVARGAADRARQLDLHHARPAQRGGRLRVHPPRQLRAEPAARQRAPEGAPRRDAGRARQAPGRRALVAARGRLLHLARAARRARARKEVLERAEGVTAVLGTDFGGRHNTLRLAYSFVSPDEIDDGRRSGSPPRSQRSDAARERAARGRRARGTSRGWGGGERSARQRGRSGTGARREARRVRCDGSSSRCR